MRAGGYVASVSRSDQGEFWDDRAAAWERRADSIDQFSDTYGIRAMDALAPQPGERLVDIGCGPGTTAVEMARRVAPSGEAIGVDISQAMVAAAQRRAAAAGITNAGFVVADAGTDSFGEGFDGAYSRFGVMFFADASTAFGNVSRSLRPGGRLACVVWGPLADNPWMFVPTLAAAPVLGAELTLPGPDEPGPFSLADGERVTTVLEDGGFSDVAIERVDGVRLISEASAADDVVTLLEIGPLSGAYATGDDRARRAARDAVIAAVEPYRDGSGWRLPGSAQLVTARRA